MSKPDGKEYTQTELHDLGEQCGEDECQECCEHEFDSEEGYTCLNCGADGYEHMAGYADYFQSED